MTDPDAVAETLGMSVAEIDGGDVVLYLPDYEQASLQPTPQALPSGEQLAPATIEGTMAGRAFLSSSPLAVQHEDGWHAWIPVIDRSERVGVLSMTLPEWNEDVEQFCLELGHAAAALVVVAAQYTDRFHVLRRRAEMSPAAEIQWSLLPPVAFAAGTTTVAGLLEPTYDVGGDCFDYAWNDGMLDLAVFDAMGHGIDSAVLASLTVGAYRNGRRSHGGSGSLGELALDIDEAVRVHRHGEAFVTAVIADLDTATGRLRWITAGHPAPLHVRRGGTLPEVDFHPNPPLGLRDLAGGETIEMVETRLEPGDALLLYTDGVTDAESTTGELFGEHRLRDLLEREYNSERGPSEILRRLVQDALRYRGSRLRDDASMLYLQWGGPPDNDSA